MDNERVYWIETQPQGQEELRPAYYKNMIESVKEMRRIDKEYAYHLEITSSKYTYMRYVKKYEIKPKVESMYSNINWGIVYENVIINTNSSELKAINYKVLFDALACNQRFNGEKVKCVLCDREEESRNHLFLKCEISKGLFKSMREFMVKDWEMNEENIFLCINLTKHDTKIVSLYKYSIWKIRNLVKLSNQVNITQTFRRLINYYFGLLFI